MVVKSVYDKFGPDWEDDNKIKDISSELGKNKITATPETIKYISSNIIKKHASF